VVIKEMIKRSFWNLVLFLHAFVCYFMLCMKDQTGMAKVTGPLMSFSASGTIGDALTFATWKGIEYVRQWFIPGNPQTTKQVNLRTALTLAVALWQSYSDPTKAAWDAFAAGTRQSGFNQVVGRSLKAYITDHGTDVEVDGVSADQVAPGETWTWTPVV